MLFQEFMRTIDSAPPAAAYLFCPYKAPRSSTATFEPFLAEEAAARLVAQLVDPAAKDLAYTAYYADETPPPEVLLEARSVPFLASRRVVLVRHAETYLVESEGDPIVAYLENPADTAVLLFIASRMDKRTRFYKACGRAGQVVECPQLNAREALEWVHEKVTALGKTITAGAARELVDRAGTHLSDVDNAVTLVANFVGDRNRLDVQDVAAACADVAEEEVWALTDAIALSNVERALGALHKLMDMGKKEDELMGLINWLLKSAYAVAAAGDGRPDLKPFVARKVAPLAQKLGLRKLRDAFALCTDTHYMIRTTGVNGALALELLVVKLAVPAKRHGV